MFPSATQERLLRAALTPGGKAIEAWQQWKSEVNLDLLDDESYRLLPALYKNLTALKVQDPLITRLAGIYRSTWYKNQLLFKEAGIIVKEFEKNGIQACLLKGISLAFWVYEDAGLRPMNDFDILVRHSEVEKSFSILDTLGWRPKFPQAFHQHIKFSNSLNWVSDRPLDVDIHWYPLKYRRGDERVEQFWQRAELNVRESLSVYIPSAPDHLLHVVEHTMQWSPSYPSLYWIGDAKALIERFAGAADWAVFVELARANQLVLSARIVLAYLERRFSIPIPAEVQAALMQAPAKTVERIEYRLKTKKPGPLGWAPMFLFRYVAFIGAGPLWKKIVTLPSYVKFILLVDDWRVGLPLLFRRLVANLRKSET